MKTIKEVNKNANDDTMTEAIMKHMHEDMETLKRDVAVIKYILYLVSIIFALQHLGLTTFLVNIILVILSFGK